MLSDEEKEAVEYFKDDINYLEDALNHPNFLGHFIAIRDKEFQMLKILVNLIEKQSKEIEHQKEKRENQKKELAILNAKQIEFNKLVNTVNSYKGQFKKQEKEIEELKEKNRQGKMRIVQLENEITARIEDVNKYFTPNDKIKAKIEVLEKLQKEFPNNDEIRIKIIAYKELLEKE